MKRTFFAIAALMVFSAILTGCQPTPEAPVVVQKDDLKIEAAEKNDAAEDAGEAMNFPEEIKEDLREMSDILSVEVDAEIFAPQSGKTPVARLQKRPVSKNEQIAILKYLADGQTPSYFREREDYSKSELEKLIIEMKGGFGSDLYDADPDRYFAEYGSEIAHLEELYAKATETGVVEYFDEAAPRFDEGMEWDGGKMQKAQFCFQGGDNFVYYNCDQMYPDGLVISAENDPNGGVTISEAQAREKAYECVRGLGFADFEADAVGLVPYPDKEENWPESSFTYDELPKCYIYYFTRQVGGMNETYTNMQFYGGSPYGAVWHPEQIVVTVADCGVVSVMKYCDPAEAEIIEENAKIIGLGEAMERFYQLIAQHACYGEDENVIHRKINIDEIRLGGMRIIEKGTENYLFIPVWSFFGTVTETYAEGMGDPANVNENNEWVERDFRQCILTVNAIDGSVIDRSQGY